MCGVRAAKRKNSKAANEEQERLRRFDLTGFKIAIVGDIVGQSRLGVLGSRISQTGGDFTAQRQRLLDQDIGPEAEKPPDQAFGVRHGGNEAQAPVRKFLHGLVCR